MKQMTVESDFTEFFLKTKKPNNNKVGSYLLALKNINKLLRGGFLPDFQFDDIYSVDDIATLRKLHRYLLDEGQRPGTPLLAAPIPPSHLKKRFCAGALHNLIQYRLNESAITDVLAKCQDATSPLEVAKTIASSDTSKLLFRKVVLGNYGNACCLTNLDVRETLTAAIIDPDADGKSIFRPDNALCLSATYAAAFKAHLITFDDKLRLVLSKSLKEHTTSSVFASTFEVYDGTRIRPARKFQPMEKFLARHRELLAG